MEQINEVQRQTQIRLEYFRGDLLEAGQFGQLHGISDGMALSILQVFEPAVTIKKIREAMRYLSQKNLITFATQTETEWRMVVNSTGIDVLEGNANCPVGIRLRKRDHG
jgi:hypothetical protein